MFGTVSFDFSAEGVEVRRVTLDVESSLQVVQCELTLVATGLNTICYELAIHS